MDRLGAALRWLQGRTAPQERQMMNWLFDGAPPAWMDVGSGRARGRMVPLGACAEEMNRSPAEIVVLVRRGAIRGRFVGDELYVEPGIISGPGAVVTAADIQELTDQGLMRTEVGRKGTRYAVAESVAR